MSKEKITLRELREMSGKSITEMAKALGVTPQAIGNYEHGIRRISLEQVLSMAKLCDVSAEEVIEAQLNILHVR